MRGQGQVQKKSLKQEYHTNIQIGTLMEGSWWKVPFGMQLSDTVHPYRAQLS